MNRPPSPYPFLASKPDHIGRVTLLGAPLDLTGSFRPGTAEGPTGIRWASENLETYSPELDRDLEEIDLGDLGDLGLTGIDVATGLSLIETEVGKLLDAGSIPCVLGGEHTIALAIARAVIARHPDAMILHLDAHADLCEEYAGEVYCHASWAYHAGQEFGFDRMVQLGIRSGLREEFHLGRERCAYFSKDVELPDPIRAQLALYPVYVSLDIDVLDTPFAPGTGTPECDGPTFRELAACLYSLAHLNVVAMDINEVAPPHDPSGITCAAAAKLAREMMLMYGSK
ncbi:MAG: agmatinase [Armatimonadota bacterium]